MIPRRENVPEDTEENREICRKYCTICPTYRAHHFENCEPKELFSKHQLRGGYFCVKR
jgi:hypothetical protein